MIKNLILSGCSTKIFAFLGSLQCLIVNKRIKFKNLDNILCTSGSSIIILLLLIGYNLKDVTKLCCNIDIELLFYKNKYNNNIINNIFENKSILNTKQIRNTIEIIIYNKIKRKILTFKQLFDISGITFIINAFCYDTNKIEYFSHKTHPDVNIIEIILMTIAIPILFPPVIYDGKTYCDAGIKYNIDFNYFFENKTPYEIAYLKKITLGLYIKTITKPYITIADTNNTNNTNNIEQLKDYISNILKVLTNHDDYNNLIKTNYNVIDIVLNLNFYNLQINDDIKHKLIIYGYKKTYDYIIN